MKLLSKYKNLVVSGCSFTSNFPAKPKEPWNWPNMIADWSGMHIYNLAIPGAGNSHISKSIKLFLSTNKLSPEDTLVIVMWSGIGRIDFITDPSLSNFKSSYPFIYDYFANKAELSLGGNWWNIRNPSNIQKLIIEYSKYQSDYTLAVESFLEMSSLNNFLQTANYKNYQTSFCNYNRLSELKGDACVVDYWTVLKELNLSLDTSNWIPFDETDYYGNWARKNNLIDPYDDCHPYKDAPERWPKEILIPYLIKENILYYE